MGTKLIPGYFAILTASDRSINSHTKFLVSVPQNQGGGVELIIIHHGNHILDMWKVSPMTHSQAAQINRNIPGLHVMVFLLLGITNDDSLCDECTCTI